jgi:segregation and condensation protein A
MQDYTIRLDAFEGPLDLLMHLIERNKIDIYDIPIATLTEQYMEYLAKFKEFNIEVASEFLVMAATLLQIKSRILLPKVKKIEAEEEEEDPRQELVDRLLEYRRFKEVSDILDQLAQEQEKMFFRPPADLPAHYLPPENMEVGLLWEAFLTVLEANEVPQVSLVKREVFSVQDKMVDILAMLGKSGGEIHFSEAFSHSGTKSEVITTFLALLELIKVKRIAIRQPQSFAEIYIRARTGEV